MSFSCIELPYCRDPSGYFSTLLDLPWAVWLDSGDVGRYDILTAAPHHTLQLDVETVCGNPFELLRDQLGESLAAVDNVPFAGGVLGCWGYGLAKRLITLPDVRQNDVSFPDMMVGFYDWSLVLDHQQQTAKLVSRQQYAETVTLLPKILARLRKYSVATQVEIEKNSFRVLGQVESNFSRASYEVAFHQVKNYLQAGDCYQINLAQRFSVAAQGDAFVAYLALRQRSPAPYSAFLNFPQVQILCNAPEQFLRVQAGRVTTKPIKGTRPRNSNIMRDQQLADELRHASKDRAENLMIVDLLRNDLGKSCVPGSVRVPQLFEVESYANVHHLVSTVEGELASGRDALHLLQDCFPGGSVTGAPKRRAMQIIDQLEPSSRGVYCGVIGYIGFDGNMDTNIAIRTMTYSDNTLRCWAGGGVVADSQCEAEYQETLDKASAMLDLMHQFSGTCD